MERKTIWIINQYASHLETRHWELAQSFADQGYNVVVITSSFHHGRREYIYDDPVKIVERLPGVSYVYLHSGPPYTNNGGKRIFNMLDFCLMCRRYQKVIAKHTGGPSYVIASSAPPFVWEVGYSIARKYHAKFIAEFRDIWPQSLIDVQGVSPHHPLVVLLSIIEKRAYRHADAIVSTMPQAWRHVLEVTEVPREKVYWMANGINVAKVENSLKTDVALPEDLEDYLTRHWCGVYIGSIVKSECLDYMLNAISGIKDKDIYFAIIGDGHEKEKMQKLAAKLELDQVQFFPAIQKEMIPKAIKEAEFCIAAHHDLPIYRYGLSMNKLNDYLASGKPTVFACDADNIVKEAGHFAISMNDKNKFIEAVETIKGLSDAEVNELSDKAKKLIKDEYNYREIGNRYLKMMESIK